MGESLFIMGSSNFGFPRRRPAAAMAPDPGASHNVLQYLGPDTTKYAEGFEDCGAYDIFGGQGTGFNEVKTLQPYITKYAEDFEDNGAYDTSGGHGTGFNEVKTLQLGITKYAGDFEDNGAYDF